MKRNQVLAIIGVLCSFIVIAHEEALPIPQVSSIPQKEFIPQAKKPKRKKKKSSISLAFNMCIRALEETFKDLLNKEIAHILSQLPMWIDRLGTRAILIENEEGVMTPHNILVVLQFVKDKCHVDQFFKKPDSYLQKLWQHSSYEDRVSYLAILLSLYDESLSFFDELFYVLSASLTPLQQQYVESYYHSLSEDGDESKRNQEETLMKNDSQQDNDKAPSNHED